MAFSLARAELDDIARGAEDPDLEDLEEAARQIALAENVAVFQGWEEAGIIGIDRRLAARADPAERRPHRVSATHRPRRGGAPALGRQRALRPRAVARIYKAVVETTEHGGYPLFDHLRKILDGPLVWAPGVDGAIVASLRGGDFLFERGQDIAIGYDNHDAENVELYLVESFTFRVVTPEAAVALPAAKAARKRR